MYMGCIILLLHLFVIVFINDAMLFIDDVMYFIDDAILQCNRDRVKWILQFGKGEASLSS